MADLPFSDVIKTSGAKVGKVDQHSSARSLGMQQTNRIDFLSQWIDVAPGVWALPELAYLAMLF